MARYGDGQRGKGAVLTIFRVAETGSTNIDMLASASAGTSIEGDWLIAGRQTAGRGRKGRGWASPPGNLFASGLVSLRPGDPSAPTLALVAAVALADALAVSGSTLKWPNDLLVGKAKLAGILLERQGNQVVVGIGVNLVRHPDLPERPTTSLAALGIVRSIETVIAAIIAALDHWLAVWRTDLAVIRTAWLTRAHPPGTPLSAAAPDGSRTDGRFDGLTEDCALRLALADGSVRVIHAGDVFLI